jgi:hypothetical protein
LITQLVVNTPIRHNDGSGGFLCNVCYDRKRHGGREPRKRLSEEERKERKRIADKKYRESANVRISSGGASRIKSASRDIPKNIIAGQRLESRILRSYESGIVCHQPRSTSSNGGEALMARRTKPSGRGKTTSANGSAVRHVTAFTVQMSVTAERTGRPRTLHHVDSCVESLVISQRLHLRR